MGDTQRLTPDEQIRFAREQYESARDFTVAIEEEFAILDPATLALTNRFEELQAAARGTPLEDHLVGELIASEVEIRTGRCDDFEEAASRLGERRTQLFELADTLGVALAAIGTHPWSPWQEQRIIDTPHYRRNDELLRYVVWRNNSFGLHVHVAINGPDRAIAVCNGLRNFLPELLALSASSPFVEACYTHLHSARTQIFTRMFPRCGVPDAYDGWDGFERYVRFLYDTRSIDEHTQMWWSVRPHLAFPTAEIRICDAQPDLGGARSLAALCFALTARIARAVDEGEPLPSHPHRLIEENLWRAIRYGLSGELIDLESGEVRPARAHLERFVEWVQPMAEELGAAQYLAIPAANAAERQIALHEAGATIEEIYMEQVRRQAPLAVPSSGRAGLARTSVGNDRSSHTGSGGGA
ncbi:MAG TPA: YbdK family carboxylate-amine ligase [Gaiellaceae bacterium]|nr:YbdK family carboxylate-amine ligase [Gaiellaceae bacterium]